jgi:hypothetical protein
MDRGTLATFNSGKKTGKGKFRYPDGSTFEGKLKNDEFDGMGI